LTWLVCFTIGLVAGVYRHRTEYSSPTTGWEHFD